MAAMNVGQPSCEDGLQLGTEDNGREHLHANLSFVFSPPFSPHWGLSQSGGSCPDLVCQAYHSPKSYDLTILLGLMDAVGQSFWAIFLFSAKPSLDLVKYLQHPKGSQKINTLLGIMKTKVNLGVRM